MAIPSPPPACQDCFHTWSAKESNRHRHRRADPPARPQAPLGDYTGRAGVCRGNHWMQQGSPNALSPSVLHFGWQLLLFASQEESSCPGKLCPTFVIGKPRVSCFRSEMRTSHPLFSMLLLRGEHMSDVCSGLLRCGENVAM